MISMISTYLFDLDDTLISNEIYAAIYPTIKELIQKKFHLSEQQFEEKARSFGLQKNKYCRFDTGDLCGKLGLTEEYYRILNEHIEVIPVLKEDVYRVLEKLQKNGKRIGVVSNSFKKTIQLYLQKYRLASFVTFIFSSEDAGCRKDKIKFWKSLIQKEELNPQECLVIGDHQVEDKEVPGRLGFQTFLIQEASDLEKILIFSVRAQNNKTYINQENLTKR